MKTRKGSTHNHYYLTFSGIMTTNLTAFFYKRFSRNNKQILVQEYLSSFLGPSIIKHTHTEREREFGKKSKVTTETMLASTNRSIYYMLILGTVVLKTSA